MRIPHLLLLALALSATSVFAQPANDNFANRFVITGRQVSTNGTTVNSTKEAGEPAPFFNMTRSVWYDWTANSAAPVTMSFNGSFRPVLGIYTGSAVNGLNQVGLATAASGVTTTSLSFTPAAGVSYKIMVDGRGGASGTFTLGVNQPFVPVVALTAPLNGMEHTNPAPVTLSASATSDVGTVTNVTFFTNGVAIFSDTTAPYSFIWNNAAPGQYTIQARATDTTGAIGVSPSSTIVVRPEGYFSYWAVFLGDVWRYLDDGTDQGTAWRDPLFDDSLWKSGPSELGYGDSAATVVEDNATPGYNAADTDRYITTYFRRAFTVTNSAFVTSISSYVLRDDGVVVYLNGQEAHRNNIAANPTYQTFAANAGDDGSQFYYTNVSPSLLVEGVNYVAAEVHQDSPASSDISFDYALFIEGVGGNALPSVTITSPANGQLIPPGTNLVISATASDADGTVVSVAFYAGETFLGTDNSAPFSYTWNNVPQGNYTLRAVATDNVGGTNTSAGVDIVVSTSQIVPVTLIPSNSVWKYNDQGVDLGTAWQALSFNDSAWSSGLAELGYGDAADGWPETTSIGFGADPFNKYPTYYFRKTFEVTNTALISGIVIGLMRDDGAVVYINGNEVRRDGMPDGPITYNTYANLTAGTGPDEFTFFRSTNSASFLTTGTNVIAVEVHQVNPTSSDLSFSLYLIANTIYGDPPTNSAAPFVQSVTPTPGSTLSTLTSVQVIFNEAVSGVNPSDLLINGSPATGLTGGGNVYSFSFPQPTFGVVNFTWAGGHGIVDQGIPALAFNGAAASNQWSYTVVDTVAPTITSKTPPAGATLTNLSQIDVVFSENVQGVDAADMLINGSPASSLSGSGSSYSFTFAQPLPGTVNISWAGAHNIRDLSPSANGFNANGADATWSYSLQEPATILIPSNSVWRFVKGTSDASSPITIWRDLTFDDSGWSNSAMPFYYGDPYNAPGIPGTLLSDMNGTYQCVYLRKEFVLSDPAGVSNFIYRHQSDDGFVAWVNGVEVLRHNMGAAPVDPPFITGGVNNAQEVPGTSMPPYWYVTNSIGLGSLVVGTNIIAVQAFNGAVSGSSDFGINLQLEAILFDAANAAPRVYARSPQPGDVFGLTSLTVTFSEPVANVNASDLLVNGVPATSVSGSGATYTFGFAQPAFGTVTISWSASHGIVDFDAVPKSFNHTAGGSTWQYTFINPSAPTVVAQQPPANTTVAVLTNIQVAFSEAVTGINAADLLINGAPASSVSGSGATYTFSFPQPPFGNVAISWSASHGIDDAEAGANPFDPSRPGHTWQYTLIDQAAPTVASRVPAAGGSVTNLTQIQVTFSEGVTGVDAGDMLINGVPATGISGAGAVYTFTFVQPNSSVITISWRANHGISDVAAQPNAFDANGIGASWQYTTPDNVAPDIAGISPAPGIALRSLTQIEVNFNEPVTGVDAGDLRINSVPATSLSGAGAGPYFFNFAQPVTGLVQVAFAAGHNIRDLANPANPFAGTVWTYTLDPNAIFDNKIVINEIMYHPTSERTNDEWIEIHNTDSGAINLTGWRISRGVNFTFPNVTIAGGGYLVIAADVEAFQTRYPGVQNVIGGWIGRLSNGDEEVEIENAIGENVDSVLYADEGDWAIRQRGILQSNHRGWEWFAAHDGFALNTASGQTIGSRTLELRNPLLSNNSGQNWDASAVTNGTPGAVNSVYSTNVAPLITDVAHLPEVPRSNETVIVTARIRDERTNGLTVTLFYRNHTNTTPGAFSSTAMFDDGLHSDGLANDGVYAVTLTPRFDKTVVEYYVQATDGSNTRTWPAAARQLDGTFAQTANALYQVDNETYTGNQPFYRLIMTETERAEFAAINRNSDAEMNCTFISFDGEGTKVRHNCGVRIRGAGSRGAAVPNNRVNIPKDRRWNGVNEINLNAQYTYAGVMGSALALKSGLPAANARPVQYRVNGVNLANSSLQYGSYVLVEVLNSDWAENHYPNDGGGNVYRASTGNHNADLTYQGMTGAGYINRGYAKTSNQSEDDWTDLANLTLALAVPDANYVQAVKTNANVELWMRYFAVCGLLEYSETSICVGRGDDYGMYRGVNDPRFMILPHDFDTIMGVGDSPGLMNINESIWVMINGQAGGAGANVPVLQRFMRNNEFAPIYFGELKRLAETVFSASQLNPLCDQLLGDWVPAATIDTMKNFTVSRAAAVLAQIPQSFTVSHSLPIVSQYPTTTSPTITLFGDANAVVTREVRVNGSAASYTAWQGRWTNNSVAVRPGLNRITVEALDTNSVVVNSATLDVWYDDGSASSVSGTIAASTTWLAANGPYQVTGDITIANGATLTIQPGTTVYLASGADITVATGGRLLAEGTAAAPIRFTRAPGTGISWGGITVNGGAGSPETRITYAHFEFNGTTAIHSVGGTVYLDHLTFGTTSQQYVSLDNSSFVVSHCVFPTATAAFELVHGDQGIKAGGRAIFYRNFFGAANGYNDVIDFTGGNRPGPILQVIDNVFTGSDDDILDIDGTDAWVEGNIFLHAHRDGSPDSASGVSGGNGGGATSEITIIGNLFYDVDHAMTAKQGNYYTFINNTVVRQNSQGFQDANVAAVFNFADDNTTEGAGTWVEGNIIYDAEKLTRHYTNGSVTMTNNLMPFNWSGPGGNNSAANPRLTYIPQMSETTNFTSWAAAQVLREWFAPALGSPAIATGPNGLDKGGVVAIGASISGEPAGVTRLNSATLTVGVRRAGGGIPAAGFPDGSGYTHYKYRVNEGPWSTERTSTTPITLNNLANGTYRVDVVGKRDAGFYQDDAVYGPVAVITESRTWTVDTNSSAIRINEILASNSGVLVNGGTTPDAIELVNLTGSAVDLGGMRLTDDNSDPNRFTFPNGTVIPANGYVVVYADSSTAPGLHTGFGLSQQGETLYLYDSPGRGGALLDSITFGLQLDNLSVGRVGAGWTLTTPTFGAANAAARTGDPMQLRINEWMAVGLSVVAEDFIEIYNPEPYPVALGGLYLTDESIGWPDQHQIAALSFIADGGYFAFTADGEIDNGAEHLNFTLSPEQGVIALFDGNLALIDRVVYGAHWPDISQGRTPDGANSVVYFPVPTPGAPNGLVANTNQGIVINELLANNSGIVEIDGSTPDWVELYNRSASPIDMSDMSFSDNVGLPRRYVFAAGTVIPAQGYLRLRCDGDLPASRTNAGFGIRATGGSVYLFDKLANGGALLDALVYGIQTTDYSVGRMPNGTGTFTLTFATPGSINIAAPLGNATALRINEWLANPASGEDDWFEIYNPGTQPVALGGLYLTDTLSDRTKSRIPALSFIGANTNAYQTFVADSNPGGGADHVNFGLSAGGESLAIAVSAALTIDAVTFGAQLTGVSEGRFGDGSATIVKFPLTQSPGDPNYLWLTNVVINEALTHTDLPLEDAIELRNISAGPVNVAGWWLSDSKSKLRKYQIPLNTPAIPAGGHLVIYESQFNFDPLNNQNAFALSSAKGDEIYLSSSTNGVPNGYRNSVRFEAAENGVSFGRYITSDNRDHFVAMSAHTFGVSDPGSVEQFRTGTGAANAYPKVGPIVFGQIMYHPPDIGTNDDVLNEFVELRNNSAGAVSLFDSSAPTNTWRLRDAVDFNFPQGVSIPVSGRLLVVGFDPVANPQLLASFRAKWNVPVGIPVYGPWDGRLANGDDELELYKPDAPETNDVPYVLVERVHYRDAAPWPAAADGTGSSLNRVSITGFGNDPTNWVAAVPTFGVSDTDGDGMPDTWESQYLLNPGNAADANFDSDGDGLTNLQEYLAGTSPLDATDSLRLVATPGVGSTVLTFRAAANKSYTIEYKNALTDPSWTFQTSVPAGAARTVTYPAPQSGSTRFYRVRTP